MANTVCGIVSAIRQDTIDVTVNRKAACDGCHAVEACHSFSKKDMDFTFPLPQEEVREGDRVIIAIEESSFLTACLYAFGIPLIVLMATIGILAAMGMSPGMQALWGLTAMTASLVVVRLLGKDINGPHIVEIISHEE